MVKVPPDGNPEATICLVGEAPGTEEMKDRKPFVGPAGGLLWRLVKSAGFSRQDCFITNVFNTMPPGKVDEWVEDPSIWSEAIDRLRQELAQTTAKVVVAVGAVALRALTTERAITKCRGYVFPCQLKPDTWVVPIIHPSSLLRKSSGAKRFIKQKGAPDYRRASILDLRKAWQLATGQRQVPSEPTVIVPHKVSDIMNMLRNLSSADVLSFDIEVSHQAVVCIAFSPKPDLAVVIPFIKNYRFLHTTDQRASIWSAIADLLHGPAKKVGQNLLYDYTILATYYGIRPVNVWMDTMIAHHYTYMEDPKGLDYLASVYTCRRYWKDEGKQWRDIRNWDQFYHYNALDAAITLEVALELEKHVKLYGTEAVIRQYHDLTFGPLLKAMLMGVRYDRALAARWKAEIAERLEQIAAEVKQLAGRPVNLNSPTDVGKLLYDELGYRRQYNRKSGSVSVDEFALRRLAHTKPHPVIDLILEHRKLSKLSSTYLDAETGLDGRMHCTYNPCGTETGRLSSSTTPWGDGLNLQNLPR